MPLRKTKRISLAVTSLELRALKWKAKQRNERDNRGRLVVGTALREQSLQLIVEQYQDSRNPVTV